MPTTITESTMYGSEFARKVEIHATLTAVFMTRMDAGHEACMEFDRASFEQAIAIELAAVAV